MTKKCFKCKQIKPMMEFNRKKASTDGFSSWCKSCHKGYDSKRDYSEKSKKYYE